MAVKGRAEDITSVRGCQTESVSRPPAVFTGQKRRGTPTCATRASPKMREKDGQGRTGKELANVPLTGVSIVVSN